MDEVSTTCETTANFFVFAVTCMAAAFPYLLLSPCALE
jgi:hypothetical protein